MTMNTPESDRRVIEIAQALGGRMLADEAAIREVIPDATVLEIYCALTALRDVLDARLAELEPLARAERIAQLGGLN